MFLKHFCVEFIYGAQANVVSLQQIIFKSFHPFITLALDFKL